MKRATTWSYPVNLQRLLEKLTAKRQEILRPVPEHHGGFVLLRVRDMAKRLGTNPATIVRVLGFPNFREFQEHLHDLSITFAASADTMQVADSRRDSRHSYVSDSVERDLKNLRALKNTLGQDRIAALARRIYGARKIVLLAGDLAAFLAGASCA